MITDHTTLRIKPDKKEKLRQIALDFGYCQKFDRNSANLAAFIDAIASGELVLSKAEKEQGK